VVRDLTGLVDSSGLMYNTTVMGVYRLRRGRLVTSGEPGRSGLVNNGANT
jgi:hypothetical protein